jgi:hypothetical protein
LFWGEQQAVVLKSTAACIFLKGLLERTAHDFSGLSPREGAR